MRRFFTTLLVSVVLLGASAGSAFAQSDSASGSRFENQVKPTFSVPLLPSFEYGDITVSTSSDGSEQTQVLDIPYLSQYIGTLYKVAVGFAGIFAIVMMMIGGFQYMIARDTGMSKKGRERIVNALVGLGITLFAFVILNTINPDLVKLNSLRIETVQPVPFDEELLEEFGSIGDIESFNATADFLSQVGDGKYRTTMMAACGNKDGSTLPTYQEKMQRLKQIVLVWADVGANQGGAIYINGGNAACTYSNPNPNYVLASLGRIPQLVTGLSTQCKAILDEQVAIMTTYAARDAEYKAAVKAKVKPLPPKPLDAKTNAKELVTKNNIVRGTECYTQFQANYDRIFLEKARNAGLLCGDCGSTIASLYQCFDNNFKKDVSTYTGFGQGCSGVAARTGAPYVPGCSLVNPTVAQINNCRKNLRFGDVLGTSKHVFMYTGGAGLGFDILEMGGGGAADITCEDCGGKKASEIAGTPVPLSGMRATLSTSADKFFEGKAGSGKCLFAWRPIQP